MKLEYRIATEDNLDEICELISAATNAMTEQNINQWDNIYPNREIVAEDICNKQLTIGLIEGKIAVIYTLNQDCDEGYINGEWNYTDDSFCVVHRLCVNPLLQNMGIGKRTMLHIEDEAKRIKISSIRLDAFSENPAALTLYKNLGYRTAGYAYWRKGKFLLLEKKI